MQVDVDSFQIHKKYYNFSKDKNHLYYTGFRNDVIDSIDNIDFASLQILNQYVFKDKNTAYVWSFSSGKIKKLSDFDLHSLQNLSDTMIKDKNGVYIRKYEDYNNGEVFIKVTDIAIDIDSFVVKNDHLATDKNSVFLLTTGRSSSDYPILKKVEGADPNSFQIIEIAGVEDYYWGTSWKNYEFSKDKSFAYYENQKIKTADPKTFSPFEFYCYCTIGREPFLLQEYSKDAQSVFFINKKVIGADLKSFEVLGSGTAKDKNHVYSEDQILEGVDPKTYTYVIAHD